MGLSRRINTKIRDFFGPRRVKWAVPTCLLFWGVANHFINQAVEQAGGTEFLPYIVKFEYATAILYLSGVVLMLIGIGRDVTIRNVLTFDLKEFKPETNWVYQTGFRLNRVGAFSLTYIVVILLLFGKSLTPFVWLLCIADFAGTFYFSLNLTRWIKIIGGVRTASK